MLPAGLAEPPHRCSRRKGRQSCSGDVDAAANARLADDLVGQGADAMALMVDVADAAAVGQAAELCLTGLAS